MNERPEDLEFNQTKHRRSEPTRRELGDQSSISRKGIAGGQYAFNPLTSSMGFSVGSDNGKRGVTGNIDQWR